MKEEKMKEIQDDKEKDNYYFDIKGLESWLPWKARTIQKYIRTGRIRGKKVGIRWLVHRNDLFRYLEGK